MTRLLAPVVLSLAILVAPAADARPRDVTDPDAPRSLPAQGPVAVQWTDPAEFSDLKYSGNRWAAARGDWVVELAEHLREEAGKELRDGERLEVDITDIRRAGMYEPWHGVRMQDVRIMRDQYPPRMSLHFRHLGADGRVIEEGDRDLVDGAFLTRSSIVGDSDRLRYEKTMIDRWLRREFDDKDMAASP